MNLAKNNKYDEAIQLFQDIKTYKDSASKLDECTFNYAISLIEEKDYEKAVTLLNSCDHEGVKEQLNNCYEGFAKQYYDKGDYENCVLYFEKIEDYDKKTEMYQDSMYNIALKDMENEEYEQAVSKFGELGEYKDSKKKKNESMYSYVQNNLNNDDTTTYKYLKELKNSNYSDSSTLYSQLYSWKVTVFAKNISPDDTSTNMSRMSIFDKWYFHYKLTGGTPGASMHVKYIRRYPDGEMLVDESETLQDGSITYKRGYYKYPNYIDSDKTFSIEFYDEADNLIGYDSVVIGN